MPDGVGVRDCQVPGHDRGSETTDTQSGGELGTGRRQKEGDLKLILNPNGIFVTKPCVAGACDPESGAVGGEGAGQEGGGGQEAGGGDPAPEGLSEQGAGRQAAAGGGGGAGHRGQARGQAAAAGPTGRGGTYVSYIVDNEAFLKVRGKKLL